MSYHYPYRLHFGRLLGKTCTHTPSKSLCNKLHIVGILVEAIATIVLLIGAW
ncbi:hypothetical protein [Tolypothrix sp. NIES-4075]|uniref:hypothetical protein n=1 Tax=Tolypothrix sp. NIES-4075 TaxID=2005459 RepID=UPI0013568546|nr:hypothetical protein [Tolypothrix sp. NIES-4075]